MHTYYTYINMCIIYCIKKYIIIHYILYYIYNILYTFPSGWIWLVEKNLTKHRHWAFDNLKPPLGCQLPINRIQEDHGHWCPHWLENIGESWAAPGSPRRPPKHRLWLPLILLRSRHICRLKSLEKGLDGWKLQQYQLFGILDPLVSRFPGISERESLYSKQMWPFPWCFSVV